MKTEMTDLLKIQQGDVYIQLPTDDVESVILVKDILEWFIDLVKKKKESVK